MPRQRLRRVGKAPAAGLKRAWRAKKCGGFKKAPATVTESLRFCEASCGEFELRTDGLEVMNGDNQPVGQKAAKAQGRQEYRPGVAGLATKTRSLHAGLHHHTEEAEFGVAQSLPGQVDQRL